MQQFKAKDKITQKMTRDGVVETNKATEEQTRTSSREAETDIPKNLLQKKSLTKQVTEQGNGKPQRKTSSLKKPLTVKIPICIFPRKNVPTRIRKRQFVNQKRQRTGWIRQRRISPNRNG